MAERSPISPGLRLALDFAPVLVFFVANSYLGIFWATGLVMGAVTISLAIGYALERKLAPVPVASFVLVLVFGGLTLWLQDETFVKIRPTIFYTVSGLALLGGLLFGYSLLKLLLGNAMRLRDEGWQRLTALWGTFFLLLGLINELVWRNVETDTWVFYNTWGDTALTLVFVFAQACLMQRYIIDDTSPDDPGPRTPAG